MGISIVQHKTGYNMRVSVASIRTRMFARSGIGVHRSTLAGWVDKVALRLRQVVDCLAGELKGSDKLGMDETTVRVLGPGRGRTRTGYMWTTARDKRPLSGADPAGMKYRYALGRGGRHGEVLLEGFKGTVQVDS